MMADFMLAVFALGAAIGFGAGYGCFKSQLEVRKVEHKKELSEAWDEVTRLRAQVALHIGSDSSVTKPVQKVGVLLHQEPTLG